jgi:hypothetical protein
MGKRLIFVLVLALALSISVAAYAETQNLKVSGDLLMRAIDRNDFTLNKGVDLGANPLKYKASGITTTTRVRIDADLTDNVIATVRLLNERSWGQSWASDTIYGVTVGTAEIDESIKIDLAYATLKEFLYSPLTLVIGRQELRYGNAMIIGDPDTNRIADEMQVPPDLSAKKSFDAIRAILNYDPLVIDVIAAKINENDIWYAVASPERDDVDLRGVDAKYDLSGLGITGTAEVYYFARVNRLATHMVDTQKDTCHTIGLLVGGRIIENLSGSVEYARQFGNVAVDGIGMNSGTNIDRSAWALQTGLNLALSKRWSPNLGLLFSYFSGDRKDDKTYTYWDPMYEDQTMNSIVNAVLPMTNCMAINAKASIQPADDVSITGVYGFYRLVKPMDQTNGIPSLYGDQSTLPNTTFYPTSTKKTLGHALDLSATYDYTEDVQFGLTFGYFDPGDAFSKADGYKQTATQVIGSMKVTF